MSRTADAEYRLYSSPPLLIGLSKKSPTTAPSGRRQDERCPKEKSARTFVSSSGSDRNPIEYLGLGLTSALSYNAKVRLT
jgi:hypothetical protein